MSDTGGHVGTGLVGAQWLMRTLSDNGRPDLAYAMVTKKEYPGWGYMIAKGATTIWELWNGDTADPAMNSGNHVMQIGDLNVWLYEYLGGIRPDPKDPGFHHILIKPVMPEGLASVKASHRSMYGAIRTNWRRQPGGLVLDVTIPANTSATVVIPASKPEAVTESGVAAAKAKGVQFVGMENDTLLFEVGSGSYQFRVRE